MSPDGTHGAAGDVPSALAVLALVWGVLTARHLLAPWLGADVTVFFTFAAATAIVLATRPRSLRGRGKRPVVGGGVWVLGLVGGFVALVVAVASAPFVGLVAPAPGLSGRATTWLSIVVLAPVFEELLYRERLLPVFTRAFGFAGAALATSTLFAAPHVHAWSVLGAFCTGLLLAGAMHGTGSIALCIGLHMGWNLGACVGTGGLARIALGSSH